MPTELRRSVVRRLALFHDHRKRRLVVALEPGDVITFREERGRKRFSAPLGRVYRQVVCGGMSRPRGPNAGRSGGADEKEHHRAKAPSTAACPGPVRR
jgi:hypothetical protein